MRTGRRAGPLGVRSFRLLCGGQLASTIGDYCYAVALPWLVLSEHGGVILLGIVLACYGVPRTVLIPAGGVLADKLGPRTLMLVADAARCVLLAGLAVLAARHVVSLAALGPVAALIGAGEGLFISALTLWLIPRSPASGTETSEAPASAPAGGVLALLRSSRVLQVLLVVVIAANLAGGGMGEVALPAL